MRKIYKIFFVIMIVVLAVVACACSSVKSPEKGGESNSNSSLTFELFDDYYAVSGIKKSGNVTSVTVPSEHDGKPVTSIGNYAFENSSIREITLPDSITAIGQGAFKNCKSLESIVIPNSVERMYAETFFGCTSLETVQLSDKLQIIADYFDGCSALKSINVPASVTRIYDNPFKTCENLTSITVDDQNEYYFSSGGVVYDKYQTEIILAVPSITSVDIPDTVMTINGYAFSNCKKLTTIRLPDSVRSIEYEAFKDCTALSSVYIPEDVLILSDEAFSGCPNLTEAVAPLHVLSGLPVSRLKTLRVTSGLWMEDNFFKKFTSLEEVELTGVQQIGQYAFSGLNNLKSVTLSDDVTDIRKSAFSFCDNLKEVRYTGDLAKWCAISFEDASANPLKAAHNLYVGGELVTELSIDGIGEIKQYAFNGFDAVTKITISGDLRTVGRSAFSLCENLTEVRYTGSLAEWCAISFYDSYANPLSYAHNLYVDDELVTELAATDINEIKTYVFSGCDSLTKIKISGNVRNVGYSAFYNCENIAEAILPATFLYCIPKTKLQTVTITGGALGARAFKDCDLLKTVTLSSGVTAIGNEAFDGCVALDSISIPSSVGSIGDKAFSNCTSLENIEIPGPIDTIREDTFSNCTALTEFVVPSSVTKIERGAFYGCKALEHIDVSGSVTEIAQGAFANCEKLDQVTVAEENTHYSSVDGILYDKNKTTIYFVPTAIIGEIVLADTLNVIGEYAFSGCGKVTGVSIPVSVTSIGQYAFSGCVGLKSINVAATDCTAGENAFLDADNIVEAVLPASLVPLISKAALQSVTVTVGAIGENAFADCAALETVTLSDGVTEIGGGAFKNTGITSVIIPDTVTSVGANAFENCKIAEAVVNAEFISRIPKALLQTVNITGGAIGVNAFKNCAALDTVTLSEGVTAIGGGAFEGCGGLTEIIIPGSVISIGVSAFKSTGITGIEIPDTVASVGTYAFDNCNIKEVVLKAAFISRIPKAALQSVTVTGGAIGANAFKNCSALDTVTLSEGVTEIGDGAFSGCAITELVIPGSVTSIGQKVFVGCTALNGVTVEADNANFYVDNSILYRSEDSFRDIVYAPVSLGGKVAITINVRSVFDGAFYGCDKITGFDLGMVSNIGDDSFYGCNNIVEARLYAYHLSKINKAKLQKVEVLAGAIDADAFSGCTALSDITLSNWVSGIGRHAFDDTAYYADESNWTSGILYMNKCLIVARPSFAGAYTVPNDTRLIADGAFDGCVGLTGINIPSSVESLGNGVFDGCGNIDYAKFPLKYISAIPKGKLQTVEIYGSGTIAANEFNGISTLKSLTVSDGITKIGDGAFGGCSSLATVQIADSVKYIGDGAFDGTAYLADDDNYENGVLYIVNSLVAAKPSLTGNYTVKADTVQIAAGAFDGCSQLTGITVPASVSSIGARAFDGCASMQSVTVAADNANYSSYGNILYNKAQTAFVHIPLALSGEITLSGKLTGIPEAAFENRTQLTAVQIPNLVTSIGDSAFYGCAALGAVNVPSSVTSIGDSAFYGCAALSAVDVPSSVTSIGDSAFYGCAALTTVSLPSAIQTMGSGVFDGCDNIVNATLHGSLTSQITKAKLETVVVTGGDIGERAFAYCNKLSSVTLSEGVTSIGWYAFINCTAISDIEIPSTVTEVVFNAFDGCKVSSATVTAKFISFFNKENLQSITITDGVIAKQALKNCSALTSVTICEGVSSISEEAFGNCGKLSSLHIPGTVQHIEQDAFFDCAKMEEITVENVNSWYCVVGGILFDKSKTKAIYAPAKLSGDIELPDTVNYILKHAFYGCSGITGAVISENVTSIGSQAFYGCTNLQTLVIGNKDVSIDGDTFNGCGIVGATASAGVMYYLKKDNLQTATITYGEIISSTFKNCTTLTSVTIMSGVTAIGSNAFNGCSGITGISIPDTVTSIGDNAFGGCSGIVTDLEIPGSVTSIGSYAFSGCSGITGIAVPDAVASIGNHAFENCTSVIAVSIPNSVQTLGSDILSGCDNIVTATLPAAALSGFTKAYMTTVTITGGNIGSEAFKNSTNLTGVTLSSGVTGIGEGAFRGCIGVRRLELPSTVRSIGDYAFYGCDNLNQLIVQPDSKYLLMEDGILYDNYQYNIYFALNNISGSIEIYPLVRRIAPCTFMGNTKITRVTIYDKITDIGERAFYNCSNLERIRFSGTNVQWGNVSRGANWATGVKATNVETNVGYASLDSNV